MTRPVVFDAESGVIGDESYITRNFRQAWRHLRGLRTFLPVRLFESPSSPPATYGVRTFLSALTHVKVAGASRSRPLSWRLARTSAAAASSRANPCFSKALPR